MTVELATPTQLDEALLALADGRGWRLLAGGTWSFREAPADGARVLSLEGLRPELRYVGLDPKGLRAGALATLRDLASAQGLREHAPLLALAARAHTTPARQRRATLGGTVVDGRGAVNAALHALEAMFEWRSKRGIRRTRAGEPLNAQPDELLVRIVAPLPPARTRQILATSEAVTVAVAANLGRTAASFARAWAATDAHAPVAMPNVQRALQEKKPEASLPSALAADLATLVPSRVLSDRAAHLAAALVQALAS